MKTIRTGLQLLAEFRRSYLSINLLYFGLVACGMFAAMINRDFQHTFLDRGKAEEFLPKVAAAYDGGHLLAAISLTFIVNLVLGTCAYITGPSLIIPFSGLLTGSFRAVVWGFIFSPSIADLDGIHLARGGMIAVLIFLEGQGYVLAMLATYVQGKAFLFPTSSGASGRWKGYRMGLQRTVQLYPLVALQLAIAAIYEATVVIVIKPLLS